MAAVKIKRRGCSRRVSVLELQARARTDAFSLAQPIAVYVRKRLSGVKGDVSMLAADKLQ